MLQMLPNVARQNPSQQCITKHCPSRYPSFVSPRLCMCLFVTATVCVALQPILPMDKQIRKEADLLYSVTVGPCHSLTVISPSNWGRCLQTFHHKQSWTHQTASSEYPQAMGRPLYSFTDSCYVWDLYNKSPETQSICFPVCICLVCNLIWRSDCRVVRKIQWSKTLEESHFHAVTWVTRFALKTDTYWFVCLHLSYLKCLLSAWYIFTVHSNTLHTDSSQTCFLAPSVTMCQSCCFTANTASKSSLLSAEAWVQWFWDSSWCKV